MLDAQPACKGIKVDDYRETALYRWIHGWKVAVAGCRSGCQGSCIGGQHLRMGVRRIGGTPRGGGVQRGGVGLHGGWRVRQRGRVG